MSLNFEGLLIVLVFIVPGFASYYARNYVAENSAQEPSVFEETQLSILNSTLVTVFLIWILVLVSFFPQLPLRVDFISVIQSGIAVFFQQHPIRSLLYSSSWVTLSIFLGLCFGVISPIDRILNPFTKKHLRQTDVWYNVIQLGPERARRDRAYLSVTLENGDVYNGFLAEFSLIQKGRDARDIALQYVTYYPQGDTARVQDMRQWEGRGLVILSTNQITAIRVKYEDEALVNPPILSGPPRTAA